MGFGIKVILDREIEEVRTILASKNNDRLGAENTMYFCMGLLQYRSEVVVNGSSERDYWDAPTPSEELQVLGFSLLEIDEIFSEIDHLIRKVMSSIGVHITARTQLLYFKTSRNNVELGILAI